MSGGKPASARGPWTRFVAVGGLIAGLAVVATLLLTSLASFLLGPDAILARFDSPAVYGLSARDEAAIHLSFAVAPVISPRDAYPAWGRLASYLESRLGITVDLVQRRRYEDVNDLLEKNEAQIGLICSGPYVQLRRRGVVRMLVVPRAGGAVVYHSHIIVRADSPFQSLENLRGCSFAFSDPLSNSGKLYPTYLLHQDGETPARFFGRTVFTYGHDRSILSVAQGVVDAAAIDSLVFESLCRKQPELETSLRIIHTSPAFGINPIVVSAKMTPGVVEKVRGELLSMHKNPDGRGILDDLGLESFELGDPKLYAPIEEMVDAVGP